MTMTLARTTWTIFYIAIALVVLSIGLTIYSGINLPTAIIWNILSALSINYGVLPQAVVATTPILIATLIDTFVFALLTVALATMFFEFIKSFSFRRKLAAGKIKGMKDHVIISPENEFAHALSKELKAQGIPHVIVTDKEEEARRLYRVNELALVGDPRSVEVYINANIQKAKCVVACSDDDTMNALIAITAKDVNPAIKIISKTTNMEDMAKIGKAGSSRIIMPEIMAGNELGEVLLKVIMR